MPSANFLLQFAVQVALGLKLNTIRALGKRPWKAGQRFVGYHGLRQNHYAPIKLTESSVTAVDDLQIHGIDTNNCQVNKAGQPLDDAELTALAHADGFADAAAFKQFFASTHGLPFTGQLITFEWRQPDPLAVLALLKLAIGKARLPFNNEADLQDRLAELLTAYRISFRREWPLTPHDRLDFHIAAGSLVIEVKVSRNLQQILRQLKRYADHPHVSSVLLVSSRPFELPATLGGKPVACVSTWRGGL